MSTTGLVEPTEDDLRDALESVLVPRLVSLLGSRGAGHCMRVTDVDAELAARLVRRLRSATGPRAEICLLGAAEADGAELRDVTVTSTKLVELRNRSEQEGEESGPLLVFVPPGLRVSAEDSFGTATFEEVSLEDAFTALAARLLEEVPARLRPHIEEFLAVLSDRGGYGAGPRAQARYLLAVKANSFAERPAGAAIHHFGLVPDFGLFTGDGALTERVVRNCEVVERLTSSTQSERQRVLALGLSDQKIASQLSHFAAEHGLEDPAVWTRRIAADRENWPLSFGNWTMDERQRASVSITLHDLSLPRAGEKAEDLTKYPTLTAIAGQPYLLAGHKGTTELACEFTIEPAAGKVEGLKRFRVEIVSEQAGPVGRVRHMAAGAKSKSDYKTVLSKLTKVDWTEGWHYVAVTPLDEQGTPLDVDYTDDGRRGGESERFYVVPEAETEEPPERSAGKYDGVVQALRALQFKALAADENPTQVALADVRWKAASPRSAQQVLSARFTAAGHVDIRLSPDLVSLQQRILTAPDRLGLWQLSVTPTGAAEPVQDAGESLGDALSGRAAEAFSAFLTSRRNYFTAIRGTEENTDSGCLITEARELGDMRTEITAYAEAYAELIAAQLRQAERAEDGERAALLLRLAQLTQIDCVAATLTDGLGTRHSVLLLSPTHPLRALWLATWNAVGHDWITRLTGADRQQAITASDSLLNGLSPLGFPFAIPRQDGRLLVAAENLTPYWGAYLPSEVDNPRGILGQLAAALRVPTSSTAAASAAAGLSGKHLAERVERYTRLHPYVDTLVMNVVNAGRAEVLADMLIELQRRPRTRSLTYDLRLCVADPEAPEAGEALADLLRAEERSTVAEAEAFLNPGGGTQSAKLTFSIRSTDEFTADPASFDAHLTVLIDAFGGEQLGTAPHEDITHAPVHGLVQAIATHYQEDDQQISWRALPRHGAAPPLGEAEDLTTLIGRLPALLSTATASVSTAGRAPRHVPCTQLSLDAEDRALLYHAHQVSDWVVTVDRILGLEYFDHSGADGRPEYVIDYAPRSGGIGHQIMVSSKSVDELRALLGPTAEQHGLHIEPRHLHTFFEQLRLLSGNLAFKLASTAPTQRTEVLGLSLARLYLDYQGALRNQVVVPLDAHPELYDEVRRQADAFGQLLSFHRSDLALFHLDPEQKTVTCRLVEVKCYTALHDVGAYQQLKAKVVHQLERSQEVLAAAFDPYRGSPDRIDRSVKNLTLTSMLRFYLERAWRHGTMDTAPYRSAHEMLDRLDDGYALRFTRSGLIFDLARTGTNRELDDQVEFHRIGRDLITELIDAIPTVPPRPRPDGLVPEADEDAAQGAPPPDTPTLALTDLTVPRLTNAAFRAPDMPSTRPVAPPRPKSEPVPNSATAPDTARDAAPGPDSVESTPAAPEPTAAPTVPESPRRSPQSTAEEPGNQTEIETPHAQMMIDAPTRSFHGEPTLGSDDRGPDAAPDVYLGVTHPSPQYGVLGNTAGRTIVLDLNETHTISLFGVQGGGKSYTLGSIMEMASLPAPPVNHLPHPLATVVFHYSQTQDYAPEFTSMVHANDDAAQLKSLKERYGAEPKALADVLLLVPADQLDERRAQYPGIDVQPLKFSAAELQAAHWRFLMGAVGNQSTYIRQLTRIMRAHRTNLTLDVIRRGVADSGLPDHLKQLAQERLNLAAEYIDDSAHLTQLVRPGRLIIVDLRDEFIEKDEALGLFVVLMQLFAEAKDGDLHFNKLVVFDEAHKYIDSPDLVAGLVESVREMRHKGMSILVASQDPPSVPVSLIELSDHIILHKFTSPAWLKHLHKANAALTGLNSEQMARLQPGEAYVWAGKATDPAFTHGAVRIHCRPRITKHGGATKTAGGGR